MSRPFTSGGANYVGVRDLAALTSWYKQKLGLREIKIEMDESEGCVALGFSNDEYIVTLGPTDRQPREELRPLLSTVNLKKAREYLNSRGAGAGETQQDRQGTHYFEIRDPEGNVVEVFEDI